MLLTVGGGAGRVTSVIVVPYIREQTITDIATVKNGEGVFILTSPRSSAPVTDRGTPAAIGSAGPAGAVTELRTGSRVRRAVLLKRTYIYVHVPSRAILMTYIGIRRSLSG